MKFIIRGLMIVPFVLLVIFVRSIIRECRPVEVINSVVAEPSLHPMLTPPSYEKAFSNLIRGEGGYVNDPSDRGGETKYGISKRSYPDLDIPGITLSQAKSIYKRDFWHKIMGDNLPSDEVATEALEQSVNMGIKTAVSFMQLAGVASGCSIEVDGKMGPRTLSCLHTMDSKSLVASIKTLAIAHYKRIVREAPPMKRFLKGWIRRVQK